MTRAPKLDRGRTLRSTRSPGSSRRFRPSLLIISMEGDAGQSIPGRPTTRCLRTCRPTSSTASGSARDYGTMTRARPGRHSPRARPWCRFSRAYGRPDGAGGFDARRRRRGPVGRGSTQRETPDERGECPGAGPEKVQSSRQQPTSEDASNGTGHTRSLVSFAPLAFKLFYHVRTLFFAARPFRPVKTFLSLIPMSTFSNHPSPPSVVSILEGTRSNPAASGGAGGRSGTGSTRVCPGAGQVEASPRTHKFGGATQKGHQWFHLTALAARS